MKSQQFSHVFNALHGRENRAGGRCESVHNVHLFTLYKNMHLFPKSEWKFAKLSRPKVGRKSRAKKNQTTGTHQQVATKRGESDSASGGRSPALNLLNPNPQTRPAPYNPPPLAGSLVMPGGDSTGQNDQDKFRFKRSKGEFIPSPPPPPYPLARACGDGSCFSPYYGD